MSSLYEYMYSIYTYLCDNLNEIRVQKYPLISLECGILVELLNAQIEVQNWRFLPSLMALYDAQTRMSAWEKTLQSKEVRRRL